MDWYNLKKPIERITYSLGKNMIVRPLIRRYFDIRASGLENLPNESAVLVMNHCIGIDGILLSANIERQIHFYIQKEGVYDGSIGLKMLLWSLGEIPVNVNKATSDPKEIEKRRKISKTLLERTGEYLERSSDYLGVFVDGPAKDLRDDAGKILHYEKRPFHSETIRLAAAHNKSIVPVGFWIGAGSQSQLWGFGKEKIKENLNFLKKYKCRVPYHINIGEPIFFRDFGKGNKKENIKNMTDVARKKIIELSRPVWG